MHDVLYLHGFGDTTPWQCPVAKRLRQSLTDNQLLVPAYHPGGDVSATRVGEALESFVHLIAQSSSGRMHVVGYSFGGLLAALLAERRPELVGNLLLLAPAIDNFARNYERRDSALWPMPHEYVAELRTYPARPRIVRPTSLVHGRLETDAGGSAPWRIEEWTSEQPFRAAYMPAGVDHSLEPWLTGGNCGDTGHDPQRIPTFQVLVSELVSE
jgi:pimeloyl-ACP methyl ester carboxylesterase